MRRSFNRNLLAAYILACALALVWLVWLFSSLDQRVKLREIARLHCPTTGALFTPDGRFLVTSVPEHDSIRIWETTSWGMVHMIAGSVTADSMVVSPDGSLLAVSTYGALRNAIRIYHILSTGITRELRFKKDYAHPQDPLAISPDNRLLAINAGDGTVWIWDIAAGRRVCVLSPGGDPCVAAFSPDGRSLILGSTRCISTWGTSTWRMTNRSTALRMPMRYGFFEWSALSSPSISELAPGGSFAQLGSAYLAQSRVCGLSPDWNYVAGYDVVPEYPSLRQGLKDPGQWLYQWRGIVTGRPYVQLFAVGVFEVKGARKVCRSHVFSNGCPMIYNIFSPDGDRVVSGDYADTVVWDTSSL